MPAAAVPGRSDLEQERSLGDLHEIEKINDRVAIQIGMNAERTREIVTLEDETRNRFLNQDMPLNMNSLTSDHTNDDQFSSLTSG